MFGSYNVGMVCTNHTYASQDMFDPDDKISGGQGFVYASSIVVAMRKLKLKEDEDGNKITQVKGIRAACKVMKTRYAKPFESVQVKIPYSTGMNPYSGLVDLAEATGLLTKVGNRLRFETSSKEEILQFRKAWERNEGGCLDKVMADLVSLLAKQKSLITSMIYVSDHGESLGEKGLYLHGAPYFMAPDEQTKVPMIIWLSDAYQRVTGANLECLTAEPDLDYSHANLFHTLLGMTGVQTAQRDPQLDIFDNCRKKPNG
jgi:hypothetical protein